MLSHSFSYAYASAYRSPIYLSYMPYVETLTLSIESTLSIDVSSLGTCLKLKNKAYELAFMHKFGKSATALLIY